jgi:hypothetical protein
MSSHDDETAEAAEVREARAATLFVGLVCLAIISIVVGRRADSPAQRDWDALMVRAEFGTIHVLHAERDA